MSRFEALAKMLGLAAEDVAKLSPEVINTLEKVSTPEISTALKGVEREKYLTSLDSAYGNKEKRATDMGFSPETYYHGSPRPLSGDEINLARSGETAGVTKVPAFYVTDNPKVAGEYADYGIDSGNTIEPFKINKSNFAERLNDGEASFLSGNRRDNVKRGAIHDGKDGAYFQNIIDDPNEFEQKASNVAAVLDPSKIRSVHAAFDPRFKDSAKLLAGAGAMPAVNVNPIDSLQDIAEPVVSRWDKLKSMVTEPLSKSLDLTKDGSAHNDIKTALDIGADPTNLIGGLPGAAIAGVQLLGSKKSKPTE